MSGITGKVYVEWSTGSKDDLGTMEIMTRKDDAVVKMGTARTRFLFGWSLVKEGLRIMVTKGSLDDERAGTDQEGD